MVAGGAGQGPSGPVSPGAAEGAAGGGDDAGSTYASVCFCSWQLVFLFSLTHGKLCMQLVTLPSVETLQPSALECDQAQQATYGCWYFCCHLLMASCECKWSQCQVLTLCNLQLWKVLELRKHQEVPAA